MRDRDEGYVTELPYTLGYYPELDPRRARKTLASAGVEIAPIRRNVTQEDVGNAAAFLCSDLAAGVTGEILYVDGGFSTVGMSFPETDPQP